MATDFTFGNNILSDTLAKQSEAASLPDYGVTNNNDKANDATKGRTIDVMASYGRNNDDSIIIGLLKQVTPDQYCNFNNRNEVFMKRLMIINQKEHDITMNALGTNAAYLGGAFEITNEALSPSYAKDINYKDNFAKNVTANENKWVESTQMSMSVTRDEYVYNNLYFDDDGAGRFSDTIMTQNPDSILTKTKKLFNTHKINTLISRFHTPPTATQSNLDVTTTYGMSKGRNLLKKNGGTYWVNGYNNPYCRVWTHHYQYNALDRMIRPFVENDKPVGVVNFHQWVNFAYKEEKNKDKYGWKTKDNPGWANSVLGDNGFVNITPKYVSGGRSNLHTKQCMFSIENLAWRGYDPYSFENALSWEQRGPMGGRIMWFPPYGIQFTETTNVNWQANTFIGRGEDVYTYTNTIRSGNLSFMMVVDHPSIIDYATLRSNLGKGYGEVAESTVKDNDLLRFFAGCDLDTVRNAAQPTPMTDEYANPYYDGFENLYPPPPPPAYTSNTLYLCVFYPNNSSGKHISKVYDEAMMYENEKKSGADGDLIDYFKYLLYGAGYYGVYLSGSEHGPWNKVPYCGIDIPGWGIDNNQFGGYEMWNNDSGFKLCGLNTVKGYDYKGTQPFDKCSFGLNYNSNIVAEYINRGFGDEHKKEYGFGDLLNGNENIFTLTEFIYAMGTKEYKEDKIYYKSENSINFGEIREKIFGNLANIDKISILKEALSQKDLKLTSCEVLGMASFKASDNTKNQEDLSRERAEVLKDWLCDGKKNEKSSIFKNYFENGGGLKAQPIKDDSELRKQINNVVGGNVLKKDNGDPDDENDLANKLTRNAILKFTFNKELFSIPSQNEQTAQDNIDTDNLLHDVRKCTMEKLIDTIVVKYKKADSDDNEGNTDKTKWEVKYEKINKLEHLEDDNEKQTTYKIPLEKLHNLKNKQFGSSNLLVTIDNDKLKIIDISCDKIPSKDNDENSYSRVINENEKYFYIQDNDGVPIPTAYVYIGSCQIGGATAIEDAIDQCFGEDDDWAQVIDIVKEGVKKHLLKSIRNKDTYDSKIDRDKVIKKEGICQDDENFNDDLMKKVLVWETLLTGKKDGLPTEAPWCCMLPPVVNINNTLELSLIESLNEMREEISEFIGSLKLKDKNDSSLIPTDHRLYKVDGIKWSENDTYKWVNYVNEKTKKDEIFLEMYDNDDSFLLDLILMKYLYLTQTKGMENIVLKVGDNIDVLNPKKEVVADKKCKNGIILTFNEFNSPLIIRNGENITTFLRNSAGSSLIRLITEKHPLLYKFGCIFNCEPSDTASLEKNILRFVHNNKSDIYKFYENDVKPMIERVDIPLDKDTEHKYIFKVLYRTDPVNRWNDYKKSVFALKSTMYNYLYKHVTGGTSNNNKDNNSSGIYINGLSEFNFNYFKEALKSVLSNHGYKEGLKTKKDNEENIKDCINQLMLLAYAISISGLDIKGYDKLIVDSKKENSGNGNSEGSEDKDSGAPNLSDLEGIIPDTGEVSEEKIIELFNKRLDYIVKNTIDEKSKLEVSSNVHFYDFEYDVCEDKEILKDVEIPPESNENKEGGDNNENGEQEQDGENEKPNENDDKDKEEGEKGNENNNKNECNVEDLEAKAQYYYVKKYKEKFVKESYDGLTLVNYDDDSGNNIYRDNTTGEIWYKEKDEEKFTRKDLYDEQGNLKALSTLSGHPDSSVNKFRYDQEYHFFRTLEQKNPMVYQELIQKIKYFDPAFHSMTPEGFNARLTFLNQCTRQGNTTTIMDGNVSSANNLAFGRPPFCVLRLGDFYHQMIVIDNISITYDPLVWDLNTEGIGVQPLLANVNISFKFIGGGDMGGPVRRLQNAMSFNYYSNASLYDNRADRVQYNWDDTTCGGLNHDMIESKSSFYLTPMYDPKNMTSYSDYLNDWKLKHPTTSLNKEEEGKKKKK